MTKEELREHCKRQIRHCEIFAHDQGEEPSGNIYEEHKLILELLEHESPLDKIIAEIEELPKTYPFVNHFDMYVKENDVKKIIDKHKAEEELRMKLINADELEPDTEWSDYYDGFTSYSQSQINEAEEVKAIPVKKVKQARAEMKSILYKGTPQGTCFTWQNLGVNKCLEILDKLIEEVK